MPLSINKQVNTHKLIAQEDIHHWRAKIASSGREWGERNGALRREKELMGRHYAQLKAALDATRYVVLVLKRSQRRMRCTI